MKIKTIVLLVCIGFNASASDHSDYESAGNSGGEVSEDVYIKADEARRYAELKNKKDVMRAIKQAMSDGKLCMIANRGRMNRELVYFLKDMGYKVTLDLNNEQSEICWK